MRTQIHNKIYGCAHSIIVHFFALAKWRGERKVRKADKKVMRETESEQNRIDKINDSLKTQFPYRVECCSASNTNTVHVYCLAVSDYSEEEMCNVSILLMDDRPFKIL